MTNPGGVACEGQGGSGFCRSLNSAETTDFPGGTRILSPRVLPERRSAPVAPASSRPLDGAPKLLAGCGSFDFVALATRALSILWFRIAQSGSRRSVSIRATLEGAIVLLRVRFVACLIPNSARRRESPSTVVKVSSTIPSKVLRWGARGSASTGSFPAGGDAELGRTVRRLVCAVDDEARRKVDSDWARPGCGL